MWATAGRSTASRAARSLSRSLASPQQVAYRSGAVDDIAVLNGLPGLGEGLQCIGICFDLGCLPQSKVSLDGQHHGLVDAAMAFLRCDVKLSSKLRIQPQCHCHTVMVPECTWSLCRTGGSIVLSRHRRSVGGGG